MVMGGLVETVEAQDLGVLAVYFAVELETKALIVHYLLAIAHAKTNRTRLYDGTALFHGVPP